MKLLSITYMTEPVWTPVLQINIITLKRVSVKTVPLIATLALMESHAQSAQAHNSPLNQAHVSTPALIMSTSTLNLSNAQRALQIV